MIKKLSFGVVVIAALAGLSWAAIRHYDTYHQTQIKAAQAAAVSTTQQITAAVNNVQATWTAKYNQLSGAYNALQLECQKGVTAYDTLTPSIRAKLPTPTCPAQ